MSPTEAFAAKHEKMFEGLPCPDCGVLAGAIHEEGCDVARCLVTGDQRLQCYEEHDCGGDTWTGRWPDVDDVIRLGLASLNDLPVYADWDPVARRWELRA